VIDWCVHTNEAVGYFEEFDRLISVFFLVCGLSENNKTKKHAAFASSLSVFYVMNEIYLAKIRRIKKLNLQCASWSAYEMLIEQCDSSFFIVCPLDEERNRILHTSRAIFECDYVF
jgi:hypothetical protein